MDLLALPPEVISALIHSGPGADSLIEASDAWQRLGASLEESAGINGAALSSLVGAWQGPSSVSMAEAVKPYLRWLRATAQQCQQIASSALAAVAAFNSARATVIPLAQVSANRTRLAQLLATNMFGVNLPAIAQTEDEYQGMWAHNSAAMSRYRAASAQATTLPQFSSPPSIANAEGLAAQASAAPAATSPLSSIVSAIQGLNPDTGWFKFANVWTYQFIASGFPINLLAYTAQLSAAQALQRVGGDVGQGLAEGQAALGAGSEALGALGSAGLSAEPTAAMAVGVSMGKLTLPPAVVGLLPASQAPVRLASAASPIPAEDFGDSGFPFLPPLMPATSAGSGWRKRKQQNGEEHDEPEESEEAEEEEYEGRAGFVLSQPDQPGSGWRKRNNYDDIEFGAELPGTVMRPPPSAG